MADRQISELVEATAIEDNDLLVLQQGETAKKAKGKTVKDWVYNESVENFVIVSDTEPTTERNHIWVDPSEEDVVIPTMDDLQGLTAEDISYDGSATHTSGSVGEAISELSSDIDGLDAGDVEYDSSTTYGSGTVGSALATQSEKIDLKLDKSAIDENDYDFASVVTFNADISKNIKSLIIKLPPKQEGTGTPSLENPRPITRYETLTFYHSGEDTTNPKEITLRPDIYNGLYDVISGHNIRIWRQIIFDGENTKVTNKGSGTNNYYLTTSNVSAMGVSSGWVSVDTLTQNNCICTHFMPVTSATVDGSVGGFGMYIGTTGKQPRIFPPSSLNISTVEQCNAWLKSLYQNGTPLTICYPYQTPYEASSADSTELSTFQGENNIWCNDGKISLEVADIGDSIEISVDNGKWYSKPNEQTVNAIKELSEDFLATNDCESFLFFTDSHVASYADMFNGTAFNMIEKLEKIYKSSPVNFCLFGGDLLASDALSPYLSKEAASYSMTYVHQLFHNALGEEKYLPLVGNHDYNYESNSGTSILDEQDILNIFYRDKEHAYYSYKTKNSMIYALNTGLNKTNSGQGSYDVPMDEYKWEQIDWLANKLLTDDPQNAIIAMHIIINNSTLTEFSLYTNASLLCGAYNSKTTITLNSITYDFSSCTGHVNLFIGGHLHSDNYYGIDNGIPYVIRTYTGKTEDPTCDLVFCDWENRFALFKRIGSGSDLKIDLDTGEPITD